MTDRPTGTPGLQSDEVVLTILLQEKLGAELHALADDVSNPDSPLYGQFVDRAGLKAYVEPDSEAADVVTAWLAGLGITALPDHGLADQLLFFKATRPQISEAFGRQASAWLFDQKSDRAQRMEWRIPRAVAGYVQSVQIVRDDPQQRTCLEASQWLTADHLDGVAHAQATPADVGGLSPQDVARIYDFPCEWTGKGETIALLMLGHAPDPADLETFWAAHGITRTGSVEVVYLGPIQPGAPSELGRLEAAMAVQWAGAMAPGANIVVYVMDERTIANPWTTFLLATATDTVNRPTVACTTWLLPERTYYTAHGTTALLGLLDQCAALGVTVISAAGDWGCFDSFPRTKVENTTVADAPWPHAVFPAVEARVLAVGGTMIAQQSPLTEVAWSGPLPPTLVGATAFGTFAGGGGFSTEVPMPDWQRPLLSKGNQTLRAFGRGPLEPAVVPYGRGVPDVAFCAAGRAIQRGEGQPLTTDGYRCVVDGKWIDYAGGTSIGAPIWAAIIALTNEARASANGAEPNDPPAKRQPVGFVNPLLYATQAAFYDDADHAYFFDTPPKLGVSPFRDINVGRTDITVRTLGTTGHQTFGTTEREVAGFEATERWDPATGLGVPRVSRLIEVLTARRPK